MKVLVGNRKVDIVPGRHTWLEAIHRHNIARKVMLPCSAFNEIFLAKDKGGFKPAPEEILKARGFCTGTAAVIGDRGRPLGRVEDECYYDGKRKTTIFVPTERQRLVNTAILCDHAFAADGTPSIQLFDAGTEKPIRTHHDMLKATEVIVKFAGRTHLHEIKRRAGGVFESAGTHSWVTKAAVLGLLKRGFLDGYDDYRRVVCLSSMCPDMEFGVITAAD